MKRISSGLLAVSTAAALLGFDATVTAQWRPTPAARPSPARVTTPRSPAPKARVTNTRVDRNRRRTTTVADPSDLGPQTGTRRRRGGSMTDCEPPQTTPATEASRAALKFRRVQVRGRKLARRISKVRNELKWFKTIDAAKAAAKNHNRPILWIQTLGTLEGFL